MRPTVGRVVHYVARGSADGVFPPTCRTAFITEVEAVDVAGVDAELQRVGLMVANPTGLFFHSLADGGCEHWVAEERRGGSWHWPERDA